MYVNDIPQYTTSTTLLFVADDTKSQCFRIINDPTDSITLQQDINYLVEWTTEWNLKFNPSKTFQLSFKSRIPTTYIPWNLCPLPKSIIIVIWALYYLLIFLGNHTCSTFSLRLIRCWAYLDVHFLQQFRLTVKSSYIFL